MSRIPPGVPGLIPLVLLVIVGWLGVGSRRVREGLARRVGERPVLALVPALVLLQGVVLYETIGGRYRFDEVLKAGGYWIAPLLLSGFRRRNPELVTWRDYAALVAFFLPVHMHWLGPRSDLLAEIIPAASVPLAMFYLVVVRGLPEPGFTFRWTWADVGIGLQCFLVFGAVAIPLALSLGFAEFHFGWSRVARYPDIFLTVLVGVAVPEELIFRGFLQSCLETTFRSRTKGLVVASLLFGASHWNHFEPLPNWRYVVLASLAGIAYGYAYRVQRRLPAASLTHALTDVTWYLFFLKKLTRT